MADLIRAEWLKAWTGKAWWVLLAVAVPWTFLVCFGTTLAYEDMLPAGPDPAVATTDQVKQWFQMLAFTAIFGAVLVSREFGTGTMSRSVLLGGRGRLFAAKLAVGTAVGAAYGALAAGLAVPTAWFFLYTIDLPLTWTSETTLTLAGVFAVSVLAAPWGVLLGWIVRSQVGAVSLVLGLILLVEPGLQRIVPELSSGTYSIALSAIYRDGKPELLPVPWAFVVVGAWLIVVGALARYLLAKRDIS